MKATEHHFQPGVEDPAPRGSELDRKELHLRTLCELSRGLAGLIHPKKILETFLLSVMGPMGIVQGLAAIFSPQSHEVTLSHRGVMPDAVEAFRGNLPHLHGKILQEGEGAPYVPHVRRRPPGPSGEMDFHPNGIALLIHWSMGEGFHGFLGLGETLSEMPYSDEDLEILLSFTYVLVGALSQSLHSVSIQQLNARLQRQNLDLHSALNEEKKTRTELDRRVFFLKTLSDLNKELGPLVRTEQLLETFLLETMGALGLQSAFVLLYDREMESVRFHVRGAKPPAHLDAPAVSSLLYKCFEASEERRLAPMSHTPITVPELLQDVGLGGGTENAFLFLMDQALIGVAGFGPTIRNAALDEEEYALLRHMLTSFLTHLKISESFEKIEQLNEDLVQRNDDLTQTIAELREAKHTIALLERARAHIKAMVEREMARAGKMRPLDFVFIVLVAASLGILFNLTNPNAIPLFPASLTQSGVEEIDVDTGRSLLDSGSAVLVDARPKEMFDRKHIRGAVSVPLALFDILYVMKLSSLDYEKPVIVYGRTVSRQYDKEMVYLLKRKDHDKVMVLSGGLKAWDAKGYEVEP